MFRIGVLDMVQMDYQLAPQSSEPQHRVDLATADVAQLRYDLSLGDLILRSDTCDLSAAWRWVPLRDAASGLLRISRELDSQSSGEAIFDFTENDATLTFNRTDDEVAVSASYSSCGITISKVEFAEIVNSFVSRLRRDVEESCPGIIQNSNYSGLFEVHP